jgi:hypothetical protein
VLDKSITATEVDIVFNKVKAKTERKINFPQFEEALKLLAAKKFLAKRPSEAYVILVRHVCQAGAPKAVTLVKVSISDIINIGLFFH